MGEPLGFTIAERKDLVGAVWQWAAHSDAVQGDWTLSAMVALRRDVVSLSDRGICMVQAADNRHATAWRPLCCHQARFESYWCYKYAA